jgi:hypothetical protein
MPSTSDSPRSITASKTLSVALSGSGGGGTGGPFSVSSVVDNGATITIQGSGFGTKPQAAPILWIFGDDVRNNGAAVVYPSVSDGDSVAATGPSGVWDSADSNVSHSSDVRYPALGHSYFTKYDGTLRNPIAFGGGSPPYADETYVSFRVKNISNWHGYKVSAYTNLTSTFDTGGSEFSEGESITIETLGDGTKTGVIVHIDESINKVTFDPDGGTSSTLNGATMTGDTTGASLVLDTSAAYAYEGGSKYLRMWSGDRPGMYHTYTVNRLISGYRDINGDLIAKFAESSGGSDDDGYGVQQFRANQGWQLYEGFMSQKGLSDLFQYMDIDNTSRRYLRYMTLTEDEKLLDRSPTISQIGLDSAGGTDAIARAFNFGEIYFDTTPKRVMLSQNSTYATSGQDLELQFVQSWSDTEIVVEKRLGALDTGQPVYAYVFNAEDSVNTQGVEL